MGIQDKFYSHYSSLGFDDVLIQPTSISSVESRLDVNLTTKLSKNLNVGVPIIVSPMDRVVNVKVASIMRMHGAAACFHRFQSIETQLGEVTALGNLNKDNTNNNKAVPVVAAISAQLTDQEEIKRMELLSPYVDAFVLDTAMGTNTKVLKTIEWLKRKFPKIDIIAGNVVTAEGTLTLINAGADGIRAGIGGGSACLTRLQTGVGRGQISVIIECAEVCAKYNVSLISDGGVHTPGDFAKAIAAGASMVMMGSPLAGHIESPGETYYKYSDHYFKAHDPIYIPGVGTRLAKDIDGLEQYKQYRGMASRELQEDWRGGLKPGTTYEGMQKYLRLRENLEQTLTNFIGGLRSAMSYCDAKTIEQFHKNAKFEKLAQGSVRESYER